MKGSLVLVIFALGTAAAFFSYDEDSEWSLNDLGHIVMDKKPCCMPDKWEAYFGEKIVFETSPPREDDDTNEITKIFRRPHPRPKPKKGMMAVMGRCSVDSTDQKVALGMKLLQDHHFSNMSIIINYKDKVMYMIDPDKQECHNMTMDQPMQKMCIDANATFLGSFRLGYGDDSMNLDAWRGMVHQKTPVPVMMGYEVTVTSGDCVIVREVGGGIQGKTKIGFEAGFFDFNTTFSDPGVFTPPSYCSKAVEIDGSQIHPMVSSFASRFSRR